MQEPAGGDPREQVEGAWAGRRCRRQEAARGPLEAASRHADVQRGLRETAGDLPGGGSRRFQRQGTKREQTVGTARAQFWTH